jgi:hypothetical protein
MDDELKAKLEDIYNGAYANGSKSTNNETKGIAIIAVILAIVLFAIIYIK